jgi:hypothetical protein
MMTPREEDSSNILSYNWNILMTMARQPHEFDFCVFDFIWEEIKAKSESPLKSCGYAPYIMHMIERVTTCTFGCDKEHHPLRIKNDLKAPVEDRRADAAQGSSALELLEGEGSKETNPHPLFERFLACSLRCASPNILSM